MTWEEIANRLDWLEEQAGEDLENRITQAENALATSFYFGNPGDNGPMTGNSSESLFPTNARCLLHVAYEIQTLGEFAALAHRFRDQAVLRVACLEATLVHARALIEFGAGRPPSRPGGERRRHPSDIGPLDFVPVWNDPPNVGTLDVYLADIDKHLSHLSKTRCDSANGSVPLWPMRELALEVLAAVEPLARQILVQGGILSERGGEVTTVHADTLQFAIARAREHLGHDI